MTTRGLIVGVLYLIGLAAFGRFLVTLDWVSWALAFPSLATAFAVYLRGEQLNARECERRRRTGWRLQADIERLERELGIEEAA